MFKSYRIKGPKILTKCTEKAKEVKLFGTINGVPDYLTLVCSLAVTESSKISALDTYVPLNSLLVILSPANAMCLLIKVDFEIFSVLEFFLIGFTSLQVI